MNNPKDFPIIVIDESSNVTEFLLFLEQIAGIDVNQDLNGWEEELSSKSPILGKYIIRGTKNNINIDIDDIILNIPNPEDGSPGSKLKFSLSWDVILQNVSIPVAIACAAGGCRAFIELVKIWAEEKKGRRIKFRKGDIELEIQGGVDQKSIEKLINMFEQKFLNAPK